MRVEKSVTGQLAWGWPFEQLTGPFHIKSIAEASVGVRHVGSLAVQALVVSVGSAAALYSHTRGSVNTPSTTPSSASHAATALLVARFSFALSTEATPPPIGPPFSRYCTTWYQICPAWKRSQWIAGAPARMPSWSPGKS